MNNIKRDYIVNGDVVEFVDNYSTFRQRFRALVYSNGLNYSSLAQKLDLPDNAFYRYDSGKRVPELKTLIMVSVYFGVSIEWLLGIPDPEADEVKEMYHKYSVASEEDKHDVNKILEKYGDKK